MMNILRYFRVLLVLCSAADAMTCASGKSKIMSGPSIASVEQEQNFNRAVKLWTKNQTQKKLNEVKSAKSLCDEQLRREASILGRNSIQERVNGCLELIEAIVRIKNGQKIPKDDFVLRREIRLGGGKLFEVDLLPYLELYNRNQVVQ